MSQSATVIQADPWTLASSLLALGTEILSCEKTTSAGKFIVIQNNPGAGQLFDVIAGDPDNLASQIQDLIDGGKTIDLVIPTFSAAHYVVVYR